MTLELVPWRGTTVPVLARDEIARYSTQDYINWLTSGYGYMGPPMPVTTYGARPAEPIGNSFLGFVQGMLYADTPVAAAEAYRLRVFGQAPLLYQELVDGRAGDLFDDNNLDRIREPWPGATLSDLMKRALIYGDFAGNAFIVDLEDELVLLRPDWVQIILEKRMHRGQHLGYKQVGIMYYEGGYGNGDGVPFLPGEYCHFVPGLPDPLASYRGMSWLTPLIREVQADKAAHEHKLAYFENSASVNLAVSLPKEITPSQFEAFVELMDAKHKGVQNAGKTLYTGGGADVTVIGNSMQQADFASIIGKGETRVANMAGVPPVLLSFSEGMQGSSLNAGNYTAAKRNFVDTTMRDLWQNFSGSVAQMDYFRPPLPKSRLWYDGRDIPFLHEDAKDVAERQQTQAAALTSMINSGWVPETARDWVMHDDLSVAQHSGNVSVQLQPPGVQTDLDQDGAPDDLANLDFGALRARFAEIERRDYLRHDKGTAGGGRFRRLSDISIALLKDWADNKGDGDPLARFNRDQLRRISKDLAADARSRGDNDRAARLTPRRGASAEEIKLALYADANGGEVDLPEAGLPPVPPQTPARELSYEDALEAGDREAAIDAAHVEMREKLGRDLDDDEADRLDRNVDAAIKRREKKNPTPPAQAPSVIPEPAPEPDVVDGGAFDEPDDGPTPESQGLDVPAAPSADFAERDRSAARGVGDVLASAPTLVTYDEEAVEVTVAGVPERDRKRIAKSLVTYQDVGWDVNSYLRHGAEAYGPGGRKKLTAAKVQRTIDDLDILFEASRLDRPVEVWRGFGGRSTFGADPDLWPEDLTGREFTDAGYVSTAADHAEATRYASQGSAGPSDERGVTARIILPAGAPVLALGAGFAESSEMLLSRGWTFRVVADHGWRDERRGQRTVRNRLVDLEAIPPADAGFAAMRADLWEFDDDEIERAFNTAQLRHAAGTSLGGEWRRMSDYAAALLKKWARGDGPDDPLGEDDFSETQLRTILKDFREVAAANGDSVRVARLTPPRAGRGDSPAVKLNRLKAVLYEDVRSAVRDQRGEPKPSAKFTLQGPAHRDLDVAVYKGKDGKPALRKENDRGEPGAVVARFDSLQELAQWADDNGEPRLGDWARAEGGQKVPAVKRVPATPTTPDLDRQIAEAEARVKTTRERLAKAQSAFDAASRDPKAEALGEFFPLGTGGSGGGRQGSTDVQLRRYVEARKALDAAQSQHLRAEARLGELAARRGAAGKYSRDTVSAGDAIKVKGMWWRVQKANDKTVQIDAGPGMEVKYRWDQVTDHRAAPTPSAATPAKRVPRGAPSVVGPTTSLSTEEQARVRQLIARDPQIFATVQDRLGDVSTSGNLSNDEAAWLQSMYERDRAFVERVAGDAQIKRRLDKSARASGRTPAKYRSEVASRLKAILADKPVAVRVRDEGAVRDILDNGRFKTAFDGARRGASLPSADPERRRLGEHINGTAPETPADQRPVYGYVALNGVQPALSEGRKIPGIAQHEGQEDVLSPYGRVQVVLKPSVRDRTSVTVGDSLDEVGFVRPSPIGDPAAESIGLASLDDLSDPGWTRRRYVEAQVHGGVRADDIEEVVFDAEPGATTKASLERRSIPWRVLTKDSPSSPDLEGRGPTASKTYPALDVDFVMGNQITSASLSPGGDAAMSGRRPWDQARSGNSYILEADRKLGQQHPREVADWLDSEAKKAREYDDEDAQDPHYLRDFATRLREPDVAAAWEALRERHRERLADASARMAETAKSAAPDPEGRGPEGLSTGASLQGRTERELRAIAEAEGIPLPSRGSREQLAAIIANMRSRHDNPGANVFADPDSPAGQGFATTTPIKPTRPVRPSRAAEELASRSPAQLRELAAAEGIPLPRTGSARELAEVIVNVRNRRDNPGANVFAEPPDTAAARQSAITSARGVADLLSTLDEQADNEASPDLLLSRLRAARDKGVSGGVVDRLEAVVGRDRAELDRVRAEIAAEHGLTPTTSAGALVPFDSKLHQIIDGRAPRKGSLVHVVRPGYELDRDGERIPLGKAVVEVATAEEKAATPKKTAPSLVRDFDELADQIAGKSREQILEIVDELNARELAQLANRFPGGFTEVTQRRQGLKIPTGMTLAQKREWLAKHLTSARPSAWR